MELLKNKDLMTPRQVASFMNELTTNEVFRKNFELNTKEILAQFGAEIPDSELPSLVKLPEMQALQEAIGEYLEKEKFGFPSEHAITAGFPLAFALTVVFVFMATNTNPSIRSLKAA
jgi:hypothetical protein